MRHRNPYDCNCRVCLEWQGQVSAPSFSERSRTCDEYKEYRSFWGIQERDLPRQPGDRIDD